jgi:HlyD family secretion protein
VATYQAVMADAHGAPTHTLLRGASWLVDDRLLPKGWAADGPEAARTAPAGVEGDDNLGAGKDRVHYEIAVDPPASKWPLTTEAALLHQPLGARWAAELLRWNTTEVETFRRLYEQAELAPEVLATDRWQQMTPKNVLSRVRRTAFWLILLGGGAGVVYFLALRPTGVRSHPVTTGTVLVEALGTGSVESRRTISVSFEVAGRVARIEVDQGDAVEADQVLAAIDDRTFQAEVALAEQGVVLAKSTLKRLEADIERSVAVLKGAEDGLARIAPLVESGIASQEALDVADERHKVAGAELSRARAAQLEGQEFIVAARRELDRARAELERTVVRSPFDGLVLRREREVGDVAAAGAAVLKLAATDTVWASVWVDETYLDALATGLPARIALRSDPERPMRGTVSRIGREVDRETRELLVDVSFDERPDRLAFGQRVDLWIELARRSEVLRIPAGVVVRVDGREGAYVLDGDRAQFRALELGQRGREFVEVQGGLAATDVVLEARIAKQGGKNALLRDGERILVLQRADGDAPR